MASANLSSLPQVNIIPSFEHLVLPDACSISDAFDYLLPLRAPHLSSSEVINLSSQFTKLMQDRECERIGDLRMMSEGEWKQLQALPAMLRIYLKYLVRQASRSSPSTSATTSSSTSSINSSSSSSSSSSSLSSSPASDTFIKQLQVDFNNSQQFDSSFYSSCLLLQSMGFGFSDCAEALCLCDDRVEAAIELLIANDATARTKLRNEKLKNKQQLTQTHKTNTSLSSSSSKELELLRSQYIQAKRVHERSLQDYQAYMKRFNLATNYREFIKGLIADHAITSDKWNCLLQYQQDNSISSDLHTQTLQQLSLTPSQFDKLKRFDLVLRKNNPQIDMECVICLDKTKDHMLMNCMHLCMCEECAAPYINGDSKTCPVCSKPVSNVQKIYIV